MDIENKKRAKKKESVEIKNLRRENQELRRKIEEYEGSGNEEGGIFDKVIQIHDAFQSMKTKPPHDKIIKENTEKVNSDEESEEMRRSVGEFRKKVDNSAGKEVIAMKDMSTFMKKLSTMPSSEIKVAMDSERYKCVMKVPVLKDIIFTCYKIAKKREKETERETEKETERLIKRLKKE